jgi:hypothetical protein
MPSQLRLDQLPTTIKDELVDKFLTGHTYQDVTQWLSQQFLAGALIEAIPHTDHNKPNHKGWFFGIELGMPFSEISKLRQKIEPLGMANVRQQLLAMLTEKNSFLFEYDEEERDQ